MTMSLLLEHFDDLLSTPDNMMELNNAILQLAIQGKLVSQSSTDEPATELIKPIKDGISPIGESELLFDVPENWLWIRLGNLGFTQTGSTPPTSNPEFYGNEYPFVRPADISDGFDLTVAYRHDDGLSKSGIENGRLIKPDSIMMVCIGSVGKVGFVDRECACNQQINVLTPSIKLNAKLLTAFMRSPYFQKEAVKRASKTTLPILNKSKWAAIPIPIPPFAEQQRIITRVEELFAQTRALAKELAHSQIELDGLNQSALSHLLASETPEEFDLHWNFVAEHFDLLFQSPEHVAPLRQSILELAVRGKLTRREVGDESAGELLKRIETEKEKLRNEGKISNGEDLEPIQESEIPFQLPNGWEWARLEELCSLIVDIAHQMPKSVDVGVKFISAKDLLDDGTINFERNIKLISEEDFENLAKRVLPKRGDIIYSRIGARLGKARIVYTDEKFMVSYSCCVVRPLLFDVEHLNFYLDSGIVLDQAQVHTKSIGVPDLGMKKIKPFLIAVPPLQEQQRIVARANQLKSLCDALEGRLQSAEEERGRLVRAVMAGVGG